MLTSDSVIDEPVPASTAPGEPFPVVVMVVPVSEALAPEPNVTTPCEKTPEVETAPPLTVVVAPSRVRMPWAP